MKRLTTGLIIIFLAVCGITSCAPPVGSIVNDKAKYDFLMLRPNRILYELNAGIDTSSRRFDRTKDLRIFVAEKGNYRTVEPTDSKLKLEIIMNSGLMAESVSVLNTYFLFSEPGRHVIRGTYGDKTDEYSIEVRGALTNPGDGSGFIGMEWL